MSSTSTTTRPAYNLAATNDFGFHTSCLERAERQMKVLEEMFLALKSAKRNIDYPVAKVAVDGMNDILDEDINDALEEFSNRLEALQGKANHFEKLEDEAWKMQNQK